MYTTHNKLRILGLIFVQFIYLIFLVTEIFVTAKMSQLWSKRNARFENSTFIGCPKLHKKYDTPKLKNYKSQYRVLPPRASMTAWQRRLMLLTSLLKLFWGSSFHSSTTATRSSGRSRGCRALAWRPLLSWSQRCSSGLRSGDSAGHSMWCSPTSWIRAHMILARCGGASSSIKMKFGAYWRCCRIIMGFLISQRQDRPVTVPFMITRSVFFAGLTSRPYCYTTPSISVSGNHIDRGISLTSTPPGVDGHHFGGGWSGIHQWITQMTTVAYSRSRGRVPTADVDDGVYPLGASPAMVA